MEDAEKPSVGLWDFLKHLSYFHVFEKVFQTEDCSAEKKPASLMLQQQFLYRVNGVGVERHLSTFSNYFLTCSRW